MIRLFASDMDGTLLNSQHVISDTNAKAIQKLQNHGIEFMIATGRDYRSAKNLLKAHNISCKVIALNGAALYDEQGIQQYKHPIESTVCQLLFDLLNAQPIIYSIMTSRHFYVNDLTMYTKRMAQFFHHVQEDVTSNDTTADLSNAQMVSHMEFVKELNEMPSSEMHDILKIMIMTADLDLLASIKEKLAMFKMLDLTSSGLDNIEVTCTSAQKGLALLDYVTDKGMSPNHVLTIGDSLNDRSMLEAFHNSYAMANASDTIKAIATYSAPSNDDHGVAFTIHHILNS